MTNPIAKAEAVENFVPPLIEVEPLADPYYSTGPVPVDQDSIGIVPPTIDQAQAAADIYNLAGASMAMDRAVTPQDVLNNLQGRTTSPTLAAINKGLVEESATTIQQAQRIALSDPALDVEARLDVAQVLQEDGSVPDVNRVQRKALDNIAFAEGYEDDSPDGVDAAAVAQEAVDDLPKNIEFEGDVDQEELREGYLKFLNFISAKANEGANLSSAGGWADFAASAIPFRESGAIAKIYYDLGLTDPSVAGVGGQLLMGEALRQIREHVSKLDTEGKTEALGTILRTLMPNAGMFEDGNDWVTAHALNEIFHEDLTGTKYDGQLDNMLNQEQNDGTFNANIVKNDVAWSTVVDNGTSLLDLLAVGGVLKNTIRGGWKYLPGTVKKVNKVSPDVAAKTWADIFSDPAVRAKFGGLVGEDVMEAVLPSATVALREGGVNGIQEMIVRQLDARDRLLRISGSSNMTAVERASAWEEITKGFTDIAAKSTGNLHINQTVFEDAGDAVKISAVFGRTANKGWGTLGSAQRAGRDTVDTLLGSDAPVKIMQKVKGKLVEVPAGTPATQRGQFFVQAEDTRALEAAPTAFHQMVFDAKDIRNFQWSPTAWIAPITRKIGLDWTNPSSSFGKSITDAISQQGMSKTSWNKLSYGLFNEITSLSGKQQNILADVIKKGEKVKTSTGRGTVYTPTELVAQGLDDKGVLAYYGYRNAADILWGVSNSTVRNQWFREGTKELIGSTGRVGFGKPLESLSDALGDIKTAVGNTGLDVFDATSGTYKRMGQVELDALYKSGGSVARLRTPQLGKGGAEATHVLLGEKAGIRIAELPRAVLTKVDGYYPHMWKGNYLAYGITKGGNRVVLGMASNAADARRVVEKASATLATKLAKGKKSRFKEFGYVADNSLDTTYGRAAAVEDQFVNWGGPVFGHRNGGTIRNLSKADGDILTDPIEALMHGMEIVGRQVTTGKLANQMRQKLYNFAGSEGILKNERNIPRTMDDLVNEAGKEKAYITAREYMHQIDLVERIPDQWRQLMGQMFSKSAALLSELAYKGVPGAKTLSKMASNRAANPIDPAGIMMGWMHRKSIASAPVSQFALQAGQSLMMLGIAPAQYAKSLARLTPVLALVGEKTIYLEQGLLKRSLSTYEKELKVAAKAAGFSTDEMRKIVDTIIDTGIVSSTSYHTMMRSSVRSAAESRMMQSASAVNRGTAGRVAGNAVRGADALTFGAASKVGFEGGENINKIITFLTLYGRDKAKGIANLSSPDYVRSLVGNVSEVSGSMIPEMSYGFQRGFLKNAFQFVSFQVKMINLLWPAALGGSKSFSNAEKAGMVLAQALLFGRRAAAHTDMLYRTIDTQVTQAEAEGDDSGLVAAWRHPSTQAVMQGLVADVGTNYLIQQAFSEAPDFDISGKFAPGGGSEFVAERLAAIATLDPKELFGLSGQNASQLYKYMENVYNVSLAQAAGLDNVPVGERMNEIFQGGAAATIGSYNKVLAVRMAEKMDGWVGSGGVISESYSGDLEGVLFETFGITTKDRASLYAAMDKYEREMAMSGTKRETEMSELANQYYTQLIANSIKFNKEAGDRQDVYDTLQARWTREQGLLFSTLEPEEAAYVSSAVNERIRKAIINPESQEAAFVQRLIKPIQAGKFGGEGPEALAYLEQAEFVKSNPRLLQMVHDAWVESMADGEDE